MINNIRNEAYPVMKEYDQMSSGRVAPFSVLSGPIKYKSCNINTGSLGFRYSNFNGKNLSIDKHYNETVNIIIGGSTVFGVGSSNDLTTISSYLSEATNERWINLGVRGAVSLQEYNHFIRVLPRFKKVKKVILLSGINDIYVNFVKLHQGDFDAIFNSDNSHSNELLCFHSPKKIALSYLVSLLPWMDFNEILKADKKTLFKSLFIKQDKPAHLQQKDFNGRFLAKLRDVYKRNFMLYSALQEKLGFEFHFYLQPFANWIDKGLTLREKEVFTFLDLIDGSNTLSNLDNRQGEKIFSLFEELSGEAEIRFFNTNLMSYPNIDIFTDRVHLNDAGAKLMADTILKNLE